MRYVNSLIYLLGVAPTTLVSPHSPEATSDNTASDRDVHPDSNPNISREFWPSTLTDELDLDRVNMNHRAEYPGQDHFVRKLSYEQRQTHTADRSH